MNNPHYLKSNSVDSTNGNVTEAIDNIPVVGLELNEPLKVVGQKRSDKYLNMHVEKKKPKKKNRKKKYKSER